MLPWPDPGSDECDVPRPLSGLAELLLDWKLKVSWIFEWEQITQKAFLNENSWKLENYELTEACTSYHANLSTESEVQVFTANLNERFN